MYAAQETGYIQVWLEVGLPEPQIQDTLPPLRGLRGPWTHNSQQRGTPHRPYLGGCEQEVRVEQSCGTLPRLPQIQAQIRIVLFFFAVIQPPVIAEIREPSWAEGRGRKKIGPFFCRLNLSLDLRLSQSQTEMSQSQTENSLLRMILSINRKTPPATIVPNSAKKNSGWIVKIYL